MAGVSTATGIAGNVSSNILSGLWNKAAQVVKDIISLPQAVTEMEDQAQRLGNVIHGINEKLAQEQKGPQIIVKAWLDKAGQAMESSGSIGNEYQQRRNCVSCCPNWFSRYEISKRVGDWKVKVAQLHSEKDADFPANGEYGELTPPTQMPIQTPKFFGNGIADAQSELESLLIEDMSVRVIGVCGMGGIGKTTLLQTINNSNKVHQSFNPIIWVVVSKDPNILNLQKVIADRLNITLPDECDFEGRKSKLYTCLKNKNFLHQHQLLLQFGASSAWDLAIDFTGKIGDEYCIGVRGGGGKCRKKECLFKGPANFEPSQSLQGKDKIGS